MLAVFSHDPAQDILLALGTLIAAVQLRNGKRLNDTKGIAQETNQKADAAAANAQIAKETAAKVSDRIGVVHDLVDGQNSRLTDAVIAAAAQASLKTPPAGTPEIVEPSATPPPS